MEIGISFAAPGSADLDEQSAPTTESKIYVTPERLLQHYLPGIECALDADDDREEEEERQWAGRPFVLTLRAYQIKNEETERTFHITMKVALNRREATTLRDALDFMLGQEGR